MNRNREPTGGGSEITGGGPSFDIDVQMHGRCILSVQCGVPSCVSRIVSIPGVYLVLETDTVQTTWNNRTPIQPILSNVYKLENDKNPEPCKIENTCMGIYKPRNCFLV